MWCFEFRDNLLTSGALNSTNSRASDLAAAAKVFREAAEANNGELVKIAKNVELYIAAASLLEQETAEASGDWQTLIDAGGRPLPSGCGTYTLPTLSLDTTYMYRTHKSIGKSLLSLK